MDARLQRRVQRYGWDKASAAYEQYWRAQLQPAQTRLLALADIKPGDFIASAGTRGADGVLRATEIRIFSAPAGEG